tara:strand:- start:80 stop:889 length:810 start_codon:yes stop_codon:yes gene_type:complete
MSLSLVLFLFLTHLGVGIAWTLLLVPHAAGVKFFRFNAGLAVVLLVIGLAFDPGIGDAGNVWNSVSALALRTATGALLLFWITVGRMAKALQPGLLWTTVVASGVMLVAQAFGVASTQPVSMPVLAVASFLSSAALLGGTCTAMILGHWYLVLPSMDVSLLQKIVKFHIGSTIVRIAVVSVAVYIAVASLEPGLGFNFQRYVLSVAGIFFWQRVLFGLLGPSVLAYLTWETAKIRSTQSATGILYVDFFTVMVGEILAKYLFLSTGVPL